MNAALSLGSIISRCSGEEPALLPEVMGRSHEVKLLGEGPDQTRESGGNRAYYKPQFLEMPSAVRVILLRILSRGFIKQFIFL